MRNYSKQLILLVVAVLVTLIGCDGGSDSPDSSNASKDRRPNLAICLDTSGSAESSRVSYLKEMRQFIVDERFGSLTLFRFDQEPAEIYSGEIISNEEEASIFLKRYVQYSSGTEGTNLLKLLQLINKLIQRTGQPTEIVVLTDCGFEHMSNKELEETKLLVKTWTDNPNIKSIVAKGVADGNREKLRALFDAAADKFSIE